MQSGRVPNLRNWGVGTKSAWGLVDIRPSLASGNRPEMAGEHRHLNYTWRVSPITSFSHRPIRLILPLGCDAQHTQAFFCFFFSCGFSFLLLLPCTNTQFAKQRGRCSLAPNVLWRSPFGLEATRSSNRPIHIFNSPI